MECRQCGAQCQPRWVRVVHVAWRATALVLLGVFLSSNGAPLTNFTFVNVLTQIGLGYVLLYLLSEKRRRRENIEGWVRFQAVAAITILVAYWAWFAWYTIPEPEFATLKTAILAKQGKTEAEWSQFNRFPAHWNKHTNAAAEVDGVLLNALPRAGEALEGRKFWFNDGGYQTLNFIPSLATMLFGLMAGTVLFGPGFPGPHRWRTITTSLRKRTRRKNCAERRSATSTG